MDESPRITERVAVGSLCPSSSRSVGVASRRRPLTDLLICSEIVFVCTLRGQACRKRRECASRACTGACTGDGHNPPADRSTRPARETALSPFPFPPGTREIAFGTAASGNRIRLSYAGQHQDGKCCFSPNRTVSCARHASLPVHAGAADVRHVGRVLGTLGRAVRARMRRRVEGARQPTPGVVAASIHSAAALG
jgi:hypothetical protein